jgi:hypothetical protein
MFDELCVEVFLKEQEKLFDEKVAKSFAEAEAFLEDCMAEVFDNTEDVLEYLDETMDITDITEDDLEDVLEVFKIPDGRYLVVPA